MEVATATSPFVLLVVLGFVLILGGHVTVLLVCLWGQARMELRLTKSQKEKIRAEVSELNNSWQETSKNDRHEFRAEVARILAEQDKDIRENRRDIQEIKASGHGST